MAMLSFPRVLCLSTVFCLYTIITSDCANILAITPALSPSHHIWNKALLLALVERGHNVTFIGPDKEENKANFTGIHLEGVYEAIHDDYDFDTLHNSGPFKNWYDVFGYMEETCKHQLKTNGFQIAKKLPQNSKIDLILVDLFGWECFYPLIEKFGSKPVIATSPYGIYPWSSYNTGDYEYPAIVPIAEYTNHMTFTERFLNFVLSNFLIYYRKYHYLPRVETMVKSQFDGEIKSLVEVDKIFSLFLVNDDPIANFPRPNVPTIIQVAGLHAKPSGPIPNKIKNYLDNAKNGFVLFSLGTNMRSDKLSSQIRDALLNAFRQIPQLVLWKFESDSLPNLPDNVIIEKWLPGQGNILAHPNIRVFITHGGALSTQEALFHGVPIIGFPLFADQYTNVNKMVKREYGLRYDIMENASSDTLLATLKEVINNPKYKENIKKASAQFRDQPHTPMERAVFWTEYVLRHGGAQHLQPPSLYMPAYQTYSLDVLALLLAIGITSVALPICLCRYLFCRKRNVKKLKTN